jgi:protein required for attachment to host cells
MMYCASVCTKAARSPVLGGGVVSGGWVWGRSKTPLAHALASDPPGRRHDAARATPSGVHAWGNSALEQTDWHRLAEERFATDLAEKLGKAAADKRFTRLIIVADAHTLGGLHASLHNRVRPLILSEIDKDWTNLPLDRIEAALTAHSA